MFTEEKSPPLCPVGFEGAQRCDQAFHTFSLFVVRLEKLEPSSIMYFPLFHCQIHQIH